MRRTMMAGDKSQDEPQQTEGDDDIKGFDVTRRGDIELIAHFVGEKAH